MTDDSPKLALALALPNTPPTFKFVDLPPELHVLLFSYFDRCTSTCLGLTSKYFYAIHLSCETKSYLTDSCDIPNPISRWCPKTIYLFELLGEWMGSDMRYVAENQKFWNVLRVVEMEKKKALKKEQREAEKRMAMENMQRQCKGCEVCGQMG